MDIEQGNEVSRKSFLNISLHTRILLGMLLGVAAGLIVRSNVTDPETIETIISYVKPIGDIFLRMIFMMVIPLLLSALILGISDLGDLSKVGRIGLRMLMYTIVVTGVSVGIGFAAVTLFQPGAGLGASQREYLETRFSEQAEQVSANAASVHGRSVMEVLVNIVPKNPIEDMARAFDPSYTGGGLLAIMFFALIVGLAMSASPADKVKPLRDVLEALYVIVMKVIGYAMQLAPFGVAALLFILVASIGGEILVVLLRYVLVVVGALAFHQFITYSIILKWVAKVSPRWFFKSVAPVMATAFSTSSSNATLPTAIDVTINRLKVPRSIANFVLTIGSTANQNGTALYEGITVLFLAQCFNVDLSWASQVLVLVMCVLAGIGTAGVPGGSLPVIMLILISVGVPGESIALIYGVDRLLDMCRTVLNVTGDITAAVYIQKRFPLMDAQPDGKASEFQQP